MAKYSEGGGDSQKFLSSLFGVLKRKDEGSLDPNLQKILQIEADEARDKPPIWFLQAQLDAQRKNEQTTGEKQIRQKEEAPTETPEPIDELQDKINTANLLREHYEESIAEIEAEIRTENDSKERRALKKRLDEKKKKHENIKKIIEKLMEKRSKK